MNRKRASEGKDMREIGEIHIKPKRTPTPKDRAQSGAEPSSETPRAPTWPISTSLSKIRPCRSFI